MQDNNAIGKLNLTATFPELVYYALGRKDWSGLGLDGSYEDGGRQKGLVRTGPGQVVLGRG